jgi:hypothetical protein
VAANDPSNYEYHKMRALDYMRNKTDWDAEGWEPIFYQGKDGSRVVTLRKPRAQDSAA